MAATSGVLCAGLLLFMSGIDASAWKILIISAPLHAGYRVCLSLGYKYGDMSQVYPIARGATPLLVALISAILLGAHLEFTQIVGIVAIALGIIWLTFHAGFPKNNEGRAMSFALGTAAFIAVFTLLDSRGARLSGNPFSYVLWLFVLEGIVMFVLAASVSALREISVIFGVIFSAWILKEKIGPVKLTCTLVVMVGTFLTLFK
ncbi:EamA family transporter [Photorhabdus sp. SF281]|uniref:EamA family transporter n=1 Tax=Photorhabdus sp. SF281 TaxID=3459527 RepID=UPI004043CAB2